MTIEDYVIKPQIFNNLFITTAPNLGSLDTHSFSDQEKIIIHKRIQKIRELRGLHTWFLPFTLNKSWTPSNGSPRIYIVNIRTNRTQIRTPS